MKDKRPALFCGQQIELVLGQLWESQRIRKVLIGCSLAGIVLCFFAEFAMRTVLATPRLWDMVTGFASAYVRDMTTLQAKLSLKIDGLASLLFLGQLFCVFLLCCLFAKKIAAALENPKYARIITISAWGVTAALLCYVTVFSYLYGKQWLNSDTSSDGLVLGKVLAEENAFVTNKWYYSTELRLVFQSLFTMPLFKLLGWTENWALIRAINIFLNCATLILAYMFMQRQLKIRWVWIAISAPLFLLPLGAEGAGSYAYWDMMIFGGIYIFFLIQIFLCLGFFFHLVSHDTITRKWNAYFMLFGLLSFVLGAQGIRALLDIQIPLFVALLFEFYAHNPAKKKSGVMLAGWSLLLSGIGYVFNSLILRQIYTFNDHSNVMLDGKIYAEFFTRIGRTLLTTAQFFGFYTDVPILSGWGILSITALIFTALLFYGAIRAVFPTGKPIGGGGGQKLSLHNHKGFCQSFFFQVQRSISQCFCLRIPSFSQDILFHSSYCSFRLPPCFLKNLKTVFRQGPVLRSAPRLCFFLWAKAR